MDIENTTATLDDNDLSFSKPEERGDFLTPKSDEDAVSAADIAKAKGEGEPPKGEGEPPKGEGEPPKGEGEPPKGEGEPPKGEVEVKGEGEAPKEKQKPIMLPKYRFDAVNAKLAAERERADRLERELETLRANGDSTAPTKTPQQVYDEQLADIDRRMAEAIADGKPEEVSKLMAESRKVEREFLQQSMTTATENTRKLTTAQVQERQLMDRLLDDLEATYPQFDANSDQFDKDLNARVLRLQKAFIATGMSAPEALVEAVNEVIPHQEEEEAAPPPKPEKTAGKSAQDIAAAQKAAATARNAAAARATPPDLDALGDDSPSAGMAGKLPNIKDLTDEEFDALPEKTKRAMRGDYA